MELQARQFAVQQSFKIITQSCEIAAFNTSNSKIPIAHSKQDSEPSRGDVTNIQQITETSDPQEQMMILKNSYYALANDLLQHMSKDMDESAKIFNLY